MVHYYSYLFSKRVVEEFTESHSRGWGAVLRIWPTMTFDKVVYLFRLDQKRWNVFKKVVKMADRLENSPYFRSRPDLKDKNILTSVKYFQEICEKMLPESPKAPIVPLTSDQIRSIVLTHHKDG